MPMKKKFVLIMLTALLFSALWCATALADYFDVNVKYYSKPLDNGYKVSAVVSPFAENEYGLSYLENVYLLVTRNGQVYERISLDKEDLNNQAQYTTVSTTVTESGSYTFTICMDNDDYEIGKTADGKNISRHQINISGIQTINPFSDVKNNAWYTDYICTAYAMGLVNGMTKTTYCPNDNMTIAQAVVLATRMYQLTTTGVTEDYSDYNGKWYQPYFDYAIDRGFVDASYQSKWNQKATRAQFAEIFAGCMPEENLENIHNYSDGFIPDVKMSSAYGPAVYKLYNAGILQGSDTQYRFLPNTNIKRSEIAAIVVRMMMEEERIGYVYDDTDNE